MEVVFRGGLRACTAQGLALEAAGVRYAIELLDGDYAIVVAGTDAARARGELEAYAAENPQAPPQLVRDLVQPARNGWVGTVSYIVVLGVFAALQQSRVFNTDWIDAGRSNAGLVRDGDLWRVFTALTLHADVAHLVGNMLIGGLIGLFVGQSFGAGLGWFCILLCGGAGNLLSAVLRPPGHSSIGASTAVFAALGILAGYNWTYQRFRATTLAKLAPIIGGLILLSFLGTGGDRPGNDRTDVLSHMTGFVCGILFGAIYGRFGPPAAPQRATQITLGLAAILLLIISWAAALAGRPAT